MSDHALLSPSGADKWMVCPGSILMEQGLPDTDTEYAREGTAAHEYAAKWLETGVPPQLSYTAQNGFEFSNDPHESGASMYAMGEYVSAVALASVDHTLLVEQRLPIGHATLEDGAEGTGDAIILHADGATIEVNDLKFGMGVKVYAKKNRQMMLYALGALHQFGALGDFKKVIMRIHQPRLNHLDEWECSVAELEAFADEVKFKAQFIWRLIRGEVAFRPDEDLIPSEKGCMWCKAKATCSALAKHTLKTVSEDFVDLEKKPIAKLDNALAKIEHLDNTKLAYFMQNLGLIEDWIAAVRARAEAELFSGHEVPGYKLVQGKKGNRKWEDEKSVEKALKDWRLKTSDMYNMKLISPANAEKLFKDQPKRWARLQTYVVQEEGRPSVAPSTDPRPALEVGAREDDFSVIEDKS